MNIAYLAQGNVASNWQVRMGHRTLSEAGTATQWPYNGLLDEVRIYNRALSATEVAARYLAQPEGQETVHYYFGAKEVAYKVGGTLYFPLQDHLGSSAVITNSTGALVESMAYYPYPDSRDTGSIATTEEKFTGQRLDSTGLYYYGARYYDPGIGRFVSADSASYSGAHQNATILVPLTVSYAEPQLLETGNLAYRDMVGGNEGLPQYLDPQALNRYSYSLNNPLRYVDPDGHDAATVAKNLAPAASVCVVVSGGACTVILVGAGLVVIGAWVDQQTGVISDTAEKTVNNIINFFRGKDGGKLAKHAEGRLDNAEGHIGSLEKGERHGEPLYGKGREKVANDARKALESAKEKLDKMNPNQKETQKLRERLKELEDRLRAQLP